MKLLWPKKPSSVQSDLTLLSQIQVAMQMVLACNIVQCPPSSSLPNIQKFMTPKNTNDFFISYWNLFPVAFIKHYSLKPVIHSKEKLDYKTLKLFNCETAVYSPNLIF